MPFEPKPLASCPPLPVQSVETMLDRCDLDDCLTRFGCMLIVLAQPPRTPQPGKRAFHHPATLQRDELPLAGWAAHDHDPIAPVMNAQPAVQFVIVVLVVRLHYLQARVILAGQLGEPLRSGSGLNDVGRGDPTRPRED